MLISFAIENWQSFRGRTMLSMMASREKQHRDRILHFKKNPLKLLPAAVIYGGNASGKTKLLNAMAFAQSFVTRIMQPESAIPREHFKLDVKCEAVPSEFTFELLIQEIYYRFYFSVTNQKVIEEKLSMLSGDQRKTLYHRLPDQKILFDKVYQEDSRLNFVADGTRDNQLFLTNAIDQKIEYFQDIYYWFKNTLILISPQSQYAELRQLIDDRFPLNQFINHALSQLDTGIIKVGGESLPIETLWLPESLKIKLAEELSEGMSAMDMKNSIIFTKTNGLLSAQRLMTYHQSSEKTLVPFQLQAESAGTERMIHLLPCFFDLFQQNTPKVYIIDELDRSMHTLLTRALLETYFQSCSQETRSQLLFTTHDAELIDQSMFRRDEIWVTERDPSGNTTLTSFGDYKEIRYDKNIRKSYLQGHLGGIPKLGLLNLHMQKNRK